MPQSVPRRILLTLGRLPKGLELARALSRAGCEVFVADPYNGHLCKPSRHVKKSFQVTAPNLDSLRFLEDISKLASDLDVDLIVPVSEEALHVIRLLEAGHHSKKLFGPSFQRLSQLASKLDFVELARRFELTVPESHRADTADAMELSHRADYVLKPVHGSSGQGLKLRRVGEVLSETDRAASNLVQARILGRHVSSFTLAREGEALLTVCYEAGVLSGTTAVCFIRVDDSPKIGDWVQRFVRGTGHDGFISFDFIVDESDTPFAIECNPRLTSGVHFVRPKTLSAFVLGQPLPKGSHLKTTRKFQEGHTTLTEAYGALFTGKPRTFLQRLGHMFTSKDVLFELRDPLPFLLMTPMSWPLLKQVLFKGMSFGEAATHDIQWVPPKTPAIWEVSRDAAHVS